MESLSLIFTVLLIHFLAVVSPGPDFLVAVKNSINFGRRAGVWTALGFGLGIGVHLIYCTFGFAVLLSGNEFVFKFVKTVGSLYLIYLAYQILIHRKSKVNINNNQNKENFTWKKAIQNGFWTNVLNPKATLFFLGLFATAIPTNISKVVFSVIYFFLVFDTFLWFSFVAFVFTSEKSLKVFEKYSEYINIALSVILFALSVKILFF